jgi:hypothetical protein
MKTKIFLRQKSDGEWVYGQMIGSTGIIRWTWRSWPSRSAAIEAAERDYPGVDLDFRDEE